MRLSRLAFPALLAAIFAGAYAARAAADLVGSGKRASAVRAVPAFRGIELRGPVDLELRAGSPQRVEIVADDNLLPAVTTTVREGSLTIDLDGKGISTRNPIRAVITAPDVTVVAIRGSGDASVDGVASRSFALSIQGSGDARLRGRTGSISVSVQGSGDVEACDLVAATAAVEIKGSGDVRVHATESVAAAIHGSGDIVVRGRPKNVARRVHGSGSIRLE